MKSAAELSGFSEGFFSRCAELGLTDGSVDRLVKAASALSDDAARALAARPIYVKRGNVLEHLKGQLLKCAVTPHSPVAAQQSGPSLPYGVGPGSGPRQPDPSMFTTFGRSIFPKQPKPGKPGAQPAPEAQGAQGAQGAQPEAAQPTDKFRQHVSTLAAKLNPTSHQDNIKALASIAKEPGK